MLSNTTNRLGLLLPSSTATSFEKEQVLTEIPKSSILTQICLVLSFRCSVPYLCLRYRPIAALHRLLIYLRVIKIGIYRRMYISQESTTYDHTPFTTTVRAVVTVLPG